MPVRIGLLGDTHGELRSARLLLGRMGKIDLLLHTGDYYDDAMQLARWPELKGVVVHGVLGNGDYLLDGPRQITLDLQGHRLWLVHGHQHEVKRTLARLDHEAQRLKADVVVFGHTHVSGVFQQHGLLLVNPGSPGFPRGAAPGSAAVLEITPGRVQADLLELI